MTSTKEDTSMISVYLADDHPAILDGLEYTLLEAGFQILGRSKAFTKSLNELSIHREQIGLLITDLSFPDGSGIALARHAKTVAPNCRVLVHTAYVLYLAEALQAGADGYLLKTEDARTLLQAVDTVLSGQRFLSPAAGSAVLDLMETSELEQDFRHAVFALLTEKERALLPHLHLENQQIGELLQVPPRTLEGQITQVRRKLNRTRLEIVRLVARASRTERL